MYKFILFDFDGTIYNTVEGITRCVAYAARKQGFEVDPAELRSFAGPPLIPKYMSYFGMSEAQAWQALADFRERYVPVGAYESEPFPGVGNMLDTLIAAGKTLAISTSKPEFQTRRLLECAGLTDKFKAVAGGPPDGADIAKPDAVRLAMEQIGAGVDDTLLVGDTVYDVEGAHAVGIPCLAVGYGYGVPEELRAAGADWFAAKVEDIADVILGL
ncbi:MAG: HAD hydrolase-like protein [Clostridia bacterium]|nr:HAD hydrolase-like protein [Clostridia bacterium]